MLQIKIGDEIQLYKSCSTARIVGIVESIADSGLITGHFEGLGKRIFNPFLIKFINRRFKKYV